ncbi:hypothetical protein SNE40_017617 [Patella caerulea]|uniref:Sushi domain-containing protein n=1 Tax=Patella caerulea TaxID=87958 RepID=A0AAN8PM82_PATCE
MSRRSHPLLRVTAENTHWPRRRFITTAKHQGILELTKSKFHKSEWICWMVFLSVSYSDASVCAAVNLPSVLVNTSLSIGVFDILHPGGLALCARECKYRLRCITFNYKASTDECQLNQETMANWEADATSDGFSFSNIDTWPETIAGECADLPCEFHERCQPNQNGNMCETIYFDVTREYDTALIGYVFDTLTALSEHGCAAECYYRSACVSFNYDTNTNTCQLTTENMTTDYFSYIGNMPGFLYSNLNQFDPDGIVGECSTQPCYDDEVCEDDIGATPPYICTLEYCLPPDPPVDVHVIPEFDQSVSLWRIGSHLKYRCSPGYYPAVNWTCSVDGYWLEPQCTNN